MLRSNWTAPLILQHIDYHPSATRSYKYSNPATGLRSERSFTLKLCSAVCTADVNKVSTVQMNNSCCIVLDFALQA